MSISPGVWRASRRSMRSRGNYERAVDISAGAEALRAREHAPRPVGEQQAYERALAACRDALGGETYQRVLGCGIDSLP